MQDLIYKRGQSGITKASVTLVFNNNDPEQCPIGYADHAQITVTRQIVVGGKNKYLVNGHNATNKVVENLFQSVQLNVNNPHFLIMQGQITKVLNMKPPEILALIEETAGTRMFEDRRGKALSTLEKKEKKMEEIENLRKEIIEPKLETLRQERVQFMEYKRAEAEIDRLRKVLIAFDFFTKKQSVIKLQDDLNEIKLDQESINTEESDLKDQGRKVEAELNELKKRKTRANEEDKIKGFEEAAREAANLTTRLETQIDLQKGILASTLKESEKLSKASKKEIRSKEELEGKLEDLQTKLLVFRKEHDKVAEEVKQTEELLQSLETGVAISEDGHAETGYGKLLRELRLKLSEFTLSLKDSEFKLAAINEELDEINPKVAKFTKDSQGTIQKLTSLRAEIVSLTESIKETSSDSTENASELELLQTRCRELERQAAECRDVIERSRGKVSHLSFRYTDPHANFDRSKVKGLVAELVRLDGEVAKKYSSALEVAAGGRLYNVVVESDTVASQLLDKGRLQKRVTIIPLNKIVPRVLGADKIKRAHNLAPGRVHPALELVGSSEEVEQAIRYVFGSTFICDDSDAANAVAFDGSVSSRAVTVDGDVYEPSGTLTGGSRQTNSASLLESLSKYKDAQERLVSIEEDLKTVKGEMAAFQGSFEGLSNQREKLSLLEHEHSMLQRQFEQNVHGKLLSRKERLEVEKSDLIKLRTEKLEEKSLIEDKIRQAQREADDFASNRTGKLKSLTAALQKAKVALKAEFDRLTRSEKDVESNSMNLAALNEQINRTIVGLEDCAARKAESERSIGELEGAFEEGKVKQIMLDCCLLFCVGFA
jgi:structural maintenance of chromosome 2